jgi:hypothetical protein
LPARLATGESWIRVGEAFKSLSEPESLSEPLFSATYEAYEEGIDRMMIVIMCFAPDSKIGRYMEGCQ